MGTGAGFCQDVAKPVHVRVTTFEGISIESPFGFKLGTGSGACWQPGVVCGALAGWQHDRGQPRRGGGVEEAPNPAVRHAMLGAASTSAGPSAAIFLAGLACFGLAAMFVSRRRLGGICPEPAPQPVW